MSAVHPRRVWTSELTRKGDVMEEDTPPGRPVRLPHGVNTFASASPCFYEMLKKWKRTIRWFLLLLLSGLVVVLLLPSVSSLLCRPLSPLSSPHVPRLCSATNAFLFQDKKRKDKRGGGTGSEGGACKAKAPPAEPPRLTLNHTLDLFYFLIYMNIYSVYS